VCGELLILGKSVIRHTQVALDQAWWNLNMAATTELDQP
jgi:hypothetical protein